MRTQQIKYTEKVKNSFISIIQYDIVISLFTCFLLYNVQCVEFTLNGPGRDTVVPEDGGNATEANSTEEEGEIEENARAYSTFFLLEPNGINCCPRAHLTPVTMTESKLRRYFLFI